MTDFGIHTDYLISVFDFLDKAFIALLLISLYKLSMIIYPDNYVNKIIYNPFDSYAEKKEEGKYSFAAFKNTFNQKLRSLTTFKELGNDFSMESSQFEKLEDIPNRSAFIKKFNKLNHSEKPDSIAVFIIDIDRFRTVNELYGRTTGNTIILQIANRLSALAEENLILAREGEDEILLLIENLTESEMRQAGQTLVDSFKKPFIVDGTTIYITASIGISSYPTTSEDVEELLQQAEIATYSVKKTGRNNYHLFLPEDAVEVERKRRIEFALKAALVKNELYLVYQPKVVLETGQIYAVESLLRWDNDYLGLVPPGEFIPIAEESGIIIEIGYWVIYEAARQTREWQDAGICIQNAINVSAMQFEDPSFVSRLKNVLDIYQLNPESFIIEITESVMKDVENANKVIRELHALGIQVAIDDFGTGYSSLSVLNNVFIDIVKIDKSFIDHVATKKNTAALVKTILQMGESLDFQIVAEGIEDADQHAFLIKNSCAFGQGYYYSKPLENSELVKFIKEKD